MEVVTAMSCKLLVGVNRTSAMSALGSTAFRFLRSESGGMSSGIAVPFLVMMRVLLRFGGPTGVLEVGLEHWGFLDFTLAQVHWRRACGGGGGRGSPGGRLVAAGGGGGWWDGRRVMSLSRSVTFSVRGSPCLEELGHCGRRRCVMGDPWHLC